ncbi:hypothetical protein ANAPH1_00816 [Anaplasma phagocytophilum]|nr:hypothetical protein ANAPH1_00816 [Anaplasma phagocytophilum]SCV65556.1 hypothetical protein ANAPH2_01300 [Anaplasma phagocytophilum]
MSDIKKGLYLTDLFGFGMNFSTGDYRKESCMTTHKPKYITILVNEYVTLQDSVTLKDILEEIVVGIADEHYIFPESLKLVERVPY